MLQKLRDLSKVNDHIDDITTTVKDHSEAVDGMTKSIAELKTEVADLKKIIDEQNKFISSLGNSISAINAVKTDFEKELYDFKLLKTQMQKKAIETVEAEMRTEFARQLGHFKADAEMLNHLRSDIDAVSKASKDSATEIQKFIRIAQSVKEKDYELEKFANQMTKLDNEKLALLRKIDSMERLVSKQRQKPEPKRAMY